MKLSLYLLLFSLISGSHGATINNLEYSSYLAAQGSENNNTSSEDSVTSSSSSLTSTSNSSAEQTSTSSDEEFNAYSAQQTSTSDETTLSSSESESSSSSEGPTITSSSSSSSDDVYRWTPTSSSQETNDPTVATLDNSPEVTPTTSETTYEWTPTSTDETFSEEATNYDWTSTSPSIDTTTSSDAPWGQTISTDSSDATFYSWNPTTSSDGLFPDGMLYNWDKTTASVDTTTSSDLSTNTAVSTDASAQSTSEPTVVSWNLAGFGGTSSDETLTQTTAASNEISTDSISFNSDQTTSSSDSISYSNDNDFSSSTSIYPDNDTATLSKSDVNDTQNSNANPYTTIPVATYLMNSDSGTSTQPETTLSSIDNSLSSSDPFFLSAQQTEAFSTASTTSVPSSTFMEESSTDSVSSSSTSTNGPSTTQFIDTTLMEDSSSSSSSTTGDDIFTFFPDSSSFTEQPIQSSIHNLSSDGDTYKTGETFMESQTSSYEEQQTSSSSVTYYDVTTTPVTTGTTFESDSDSSVLSYDPITSASSASETASFETAVTYSTSSTDSETSSGYSNDVEPTSNTSFTESIGTSISSYITSETSSDGFAELTSSTDQVWTPTTQSSSVTAIYQDTSISQTASSVETPASMNTVSEQTSVFLDSTSMTSDQTYTSEETLSATNTQKSGTEEPSSTISSLLFTPVPSRTSSSSVLEISQSTSESASVNSQEFTSTTSVNFVAISNSHSDGEPDSFIGTTSNTLASSSVSNINIVTETSSSPNSINTAINVGNTIATDASHTLPSTTTTDAPITATPSVTQPIVSSYWLPTGIIVQTSENSNVGSDSTVSISNATATVSLPKVILPDTQATSTTFSSDVQYISVGFTKALNFEFVVKNSLSSAQIFEYLPGALTFPFDDLNAKDIKVTKLIPYSSSNLDYIITVAQVEFKKELVEKLQNLLLDKSSQIYKNDDESENTLSQLIDPRVPIDLVTSSVSSDSDSEILSILKAQSGGSDSSDSNTDGSGDDGDINALAQSMSSLDGSAMSANVSAIKSKKAIAGIVVGTVVGVALYAGAIFTFVLWRRKKNARERALRNLIRIDSSNSAYSGSDSIDSASAYENYNNEKDYNSNEIGEIKLDVVNEEEKRGSLLQRFSLSSMGNSEDRTKYIPEISAPINVKNTLGW